MIADWSVEAGADDPSIDVPWEGWTNLFWDKSNAALPWQEALALTLPEVQQYPELLSVLYLLNSMNHFTSKVDVFAVTPEEVNPEFAEACPPAAQVGLGSYVDVVNARPGSFLRFEEFEAIARGTTSRLAQVSETEGFAEIIIRPASLGGRAAFGWTLYAFGFGADAAEARSTWQRACVLLTTCFGLEVASANIRESEAVLKRLAEQATRNAGE